MGIPHEIVEDFRLIGRLTLEMGLNSSHSGNLSVRLGDGLIITRTLSMLGNLDENDLVEVSLEGPIEPGGRASKEAVTHRSIYARTGARAIVHTHLVTATMLSLISDEIVPVDADGAYYFPRVAVVTPDHTSSPEAVAEVIARGFADAKIVLSRGHGAFAAEQSLERALQYCSILENSARIIYQLMTLGMDTRRFEKDYFGKWKDRMRRGSGP